MQKISVCIAIVLLGFASGCASVGGVLSSKVDISSLDTTAAPLTLRDKRRAVPNPQKSESVMPHEAFTPSLSTVLARRLAAEKLARLDGREVELIVGHTTIEAMAPSATAKPSAGPSLPSVLPAVLPKGLPPGVDVLANLLGSRVVAAMETSERLKFETALEVRVDGKTYGARAFTVNESGSAESNMRDSVGIAIKKLIAELSAETDEPLVQLSGPGSPS